MEGYKEVVFSEDTRVVAGARIAVFKAGVPRTVHPEIAQTALGMGAKGTAKATKKKVAPQPEPSEPVAEEAPAPAPKKRRGRRKKRTEAEIIASTIEFMTAEQPQWLGPECYDLNNLPRMTLFAEAVPDLTPALREAAWEVFISGQRDG